MGASECGPRTGDIATNLRLGIFSAWRVTSHDPDDQVERWLSEGGRVGIEEHPADKGIFPLSTQSEEVDDPFELLDHEPFLPSAEIENDQEILDEVHALLNKGYLKKFHSIDKALSIGHDPLWNILLIPLGDGETVYVVSILP